MRRGRKRNAAGREQRESRINNGCFCSHVFFLQLFLAENSPIKLSKTFPAIGKICGILRGGIRSANNNCAPNRRQEGRKRVKSKYLRYPHFPLRFDPHSPPRTLTGSSAALEDAIDSCAKLTMRSNDFWRSLGLTSRRNLSESVQVKRTRFVSASLHWVMR